MSKTRRGEKHHKYIRKEFICKECGKTFLDIPSKNREYCSNKCANSNNSPGSGKDNPNWKGGITSKIRSIRTSKKYADWRAKIFSRDKYTCQECGSKNKFLHAHHIIPLSKDITKAIEIDNGVTLCVDCHQKEHPNLNLNLRKKNALHRL